MLPLLDLDPRMICTACGLISANVRMGRVLSLAGMRWTTYNRIMEKLVVADSVADERFIRLAARWTK